MRGSVPLAIQESGDAFSFTIVLLSSTSSYDI